MFQKLFEKNFIQFSDKSIFFLDYTIKGLANKGGES